MTTIQNVTDYLEKLAPPAWQESYDNSGLLVGNPAAEVTGILISLDCLEEVVDEAVRHQCNLVISHHPIVFGGLKKLNGNNYVERTVIKAIRHGIALYAIHTNLDNIDGGVNNKLAEKIGLSNRRILSPKRNLLRKIVTFCPHEQAGSIRSAMFAAGAGRIGAYDECSFNVEGTGTFRAGDQANPYIGEKGKVHAEPETRVEMIFPEYLESAIVEALKSSHPYEVVAYDIYPIVNSHQQVGSGMLGELLSPVSETDFLASLKSVTGAGCIRHSRLTGKMVKVVALCGGSGSFLFNDALRSGADVFVTADYKYHQFFDAEGKIVIADVGHYESEQFTSGLLKELLVRNFSTFAIRLTEMVTNPVHYF